MDAIFHSDPIKAIGLIVAGLLGLGVMAWGFAAAFNDSSRRP